MKTFIILITASTIALLTACNGDHTSKSGKDTVNSIYNGPSPNKDSLKISGDSIGKGDTSKTSKGDASGTDNSGSGGTKVKDSTKKK